VTAELHLPAIHVLSLPELCPTKLVHKRDLSLANLGGVQVHNGCDVEILPDGLFQEVADIAVLHDGEIAQFSLQASRKLDGHEYRLQAREGKLQCAAGSKATAPARFNSGGALVVAAKRWGDAAVFTVQRGEETKSLTVALRR
jgi:hypothetical protein